MAPNRGLLRFRLSSLISSWASWGLSWISWVSLWISLGLSWSHLGLSWQLFGLPWALLGSSWAVLGLSWACVQICVSVSVRVDVEIRVEKIFEKISTYKVDGLHQGNGVAQDRKSSQEAWGIWSRARWDLPSYVCLRILYLSCQSSTKCGVLTG